MRRLPLIIVMTTVLSALAAAPAQADFHLIKISEVHKTTNQVGDDPDYVELTMYAPGENQVAGHYIQTYSNGGILSTYQIGPGNVSGAQSQRTILIAAGSSVAGANVDYDAAGDLNVAIGDGTVCYIDTLPSNGIDCVQYGFPFPSLVGGNPSPFGNPVLSPGGLLAGQTLQRTKRPGCESLLEGSDDTDDSATDFALGLPSPRNNAAAPSGIACPNTKITRAPDGKTTDRTPTFRFRSSQGSSTFRCSIDARKFAKCKSPKTLKRLSFGKHRFRVFAINRLGGTDKTRAKVKFKVVP